MADQASSGEENMLEIQSVTEQVRQLGDSYGRWATVSQVLIGLTAVVTLLYFAASYKALKRVAN
jgi:hypothetical protein